MSLPVDHERYQIDLVFPPFPQARRPQVLPAEVTDAIVVGRAVKGDRDIEDGTKGRALAIGRWFADRHIVRRHGGLIVCSADRTPAATGGRPWRDPATGRVFPHGITEAEGLRRALAEQELVPAANVLKQEDSFETSRDVWLGLQTLKAAWRARGIDPASRVVAFPAQRAHLESIMGDLAPRLVDVPYIGAIVPEEDPQHPDNYPFVTTLVRRAIVHGLTPEQPDLDAVLEQRAQFAWDTVMGLRSAAASAMSHIPGLAGGQPADHYSNQAA